MTSVTVSIIIATYNSEKTLPLVLTSIREQTYAQKKIEIIIIDGGSTDSTCRIATRFHCRVINNPNVEPLYAKYLGFIHARGRYIEYIDHDEVIDNKKSLQIRMDVFAKNPMVKALTGCGYYSPDGYHVINSYINEFGDPFSFFIYSLSKHADFFIPVMKSRYTLLKETDDAVIFDLSGRVEMPLIELVAGGGMVDREFMLKNFPDLKTRQYLLPHMLHILAKKSSILAISKHDPIIHYSSDTMKSYRKKLIWRIKNNIFFKKTTGSSGFSGRIKEGNYVQQLKKILFIPYAMSIVLPVIDAVSLMVTRKKIAYCIHVPLTIMTAVLILYYYILNILGIRFSLQNYDESVNAYETI